MNSLSSNCDPWISNEELEAFEKSFAIHSSKIMECTEVFLDSIETIRLAGNKDVKKIWNAAFHINIIAHDLLGLTYSLATSKDRWARRAIARFIAVVLYEACEDVPTIFKQNYKPACIRLKLFEEQKTECLRLETQMRAFIAANLSFLKSIRNAVGAHKDKDSFEMVRFVASIDLNLIVRLSTNFYEILKSYGCLCMTSLGKTEI